MLSGYVLYKVANTVTHHFRIECGRSLALVFLTKKNAISPDRKIVDSNQEKEHNILRKLYSRVFFYIFSIVFD